MASDKCAILDLAASKQQKANITHVIFDMDGLLLDTESIYTEITQRIVDKYGKIFDWETKSKIMGRSPKDGAIMIVKLLDLPITAEEYLEKTLVLEKECFPRCKPMPGAERLVKHLHSHNIPFCVATGSKTWLYMVKTTNKEDLFNLFSHHVCSDDPELKHGKPAPDIFQLAASRFASKPLSPSNILVLEDSPNGVQAARAANMNVVMVPDPRTDPSLCTHAHLCLKSLNEFDPELWGLPPYND